MPALTGSKTNPTNDDIIRTLAELQSQSQANKRAYFAPQAYTNYMPGNPLNYNPRDTAQWGQNLQAIDQQGKNATALSLVIAQNKAAKEEQAKAKQRKQFAQQQLAATANAAANSNVTPTSGGSNSYNAITGQYGSNPPAKGFNPNAKIITSSWRGFSLTLNASVMPRFKHFLEALYQEGYHPKSIGTYAKRNIAGTNTQSLHALGLAMDIDPSKNPVTWNGHTVTALPANVGSLAAKYGLQWGGAWHGPKRDSMHFSVPYGGRM